MGKKKKRNEETVKKGFTKSYSNEKREREKRKRLRETERETETERLSQSSNMTNDTSLKKIHWSGIFIFTSFWSDLYFSVLKTREREREREKKKRKRKK